jgi:hypothetical protein
MEAIKVASGYRALSSTIDAVKQSKSRLLSIGKMFGGDAREVVKRQGCDFVVYTPFLMQYGHVVDKDDGSKTFVPIGAVENKNDIPKGTVVFQGAYFGGNDFASLISNTFTQEQIDGMIGASNTKAVLFAAGGFATIFLVMMFVAFGKFISVMSLPVAVMMFAMAIKHKIHAETLRQKKIIGIKDFIYDFFFLRKGGGDGS